MMPKRVFDWNDGIGVGVVDGRVLSIRGVIPAGVAVVNLTDVDALPWNLFEGSRYLGAMERLVGDDSLENEPDLVERVRTILSDPASNASPLG